jgi:hypothetical protein
MRKFAIILLFAISLAVFLNGCVYTNVKLPMQAMLATEEVDTAKVGSSEAIVVLWLIALGDASVKKAMDNGGISKVHHVDTETFSILGIYTKYTVKVYGE